ncbi:MAG: chemotaxis protein CheW [Gammaproteobacteria bacterium]|nr:chemotaxis protein CheW [Gammaproteobacteria bacterium]
MNIDMSQFHGVFFEESEEHLADMERVLMALDLSEPDSEELNTIFRAAHSIKGGSGIFGFDALASVTHVLENLLDRIRKGSLALRADMVDTFLLSVDVLRGIVDAYRHGDAIDMPAANRVCERLERLTDAGPAQQAPEEGFGLFVEPQEATAGAEAYGLFEDNPPAGESASSQAPGDEGYGFFEALEPAAPPSAPVQDPGYGFFDPLPADTTPPSETPAEIPQRRASDQGEARTDRRAQNRREADKTPGGDTSSIRVGVEKIDQLINLAGELVITQSMLSQLGKELEGSPLHEKMQSALTLLERNTREMQESVMSIRMLPISFVFSRFPRVVRDLAQKLGKEVDLILEGENTELDKGLIEKLVDPMTHLVRNAIDHGIETPDIRAQRGKAPSGRLSLSAFHQGGNIVIEILDDGGGLNRERILAKARENGLALSENPSDQEVWQLIFAPGFSTASVVTDVSGRGVGMDVVKKNIAAMGGRIEIESYAGMGSKFSIRLPLTLAILDGMSLAVGAETYIVPLACIIESLQPRPEDIKSLAASGRLVRVRGEYLPLIALHEFLHVEPRSREPSQGIVLILEADNRKFALFVDELLGQQQVVIKSLETHYRRIPGMSGATILGDGRVALILDVEALIPQDAIASNGGLSHD